MCETKSAEVGDTTCLPLVGAANTPDGEGEGHFTVKVGERPRVAAQHQ